MLLLLCLRLCCLKMTAVWGMLWLSFHGIASLTLLRLVPHSSRSCAGVSTYNVAPQQAGAYFNKIQCFCFEEQRLRAGEKVDMPVFFYLDPEFATDPRMRSISHLTLSYTFFKVDDEDYDAEELQEQLNNRGKAFHGLAAAQ